MPAFSVSVQPQVKVALLRDAHIGKHAPGCTPQGAVKHGCRTFVEEPFGTDAALLKDGCKLGCACACGLLVGAEGEDYGATRTVPTSKKVLKRLELPHEHVLDVERSPAPDEGLVKIPGEGVVQPVLLRAGDYRNNVLVSEEQRTGKRGVCSQAGDEKVSPHLLEGGCRHDVRKRGPHERVQALEGYVLGLLAMVYGLAGNRARKTLAGPGVVEVWVVFFACVMCVYIDTAHGFPSTAHGLSKFSFPW